MNKLAAVIVIFVVIIALAALIAVIATHERPNAISTTVTSNETTGISANNTTIPTGLKSLSIANYSYDYKIRLLNSSAGVPVAAGFVTGSQAFYLSPNATLTIRVLTYSDNETVDAAYNHISNFSGSNATYIKNMPKGYIGVISKYRSSYIYGIILMKGYSIYTVSVAQTPGKYINPNATVSTLLYAMNKTV